MLRVTALSFFMTLAMTGVAWAHVEVSPTQVPPSGAETFTVDVAGEKSAPAVEVRIQVPKGFEVTNVSAPSGWQGKLKGDSIVWSGGELAQDRAAQFTFEARTPGEASETTWKGFVTYQDDSVVEWTGPPDSEHPASVVNVVSGGPGGTRTGGIQTGGSGESMPDTGGIAPALLISLTGFAALALGLIGLAVLRRA